MRQYFFQGVTLLITVYNRSRSLERLLVALDSIGCTFEDTVVSDDGSKPEHVEYIRKLQQRFQFRLITSSVNKGLGNNLNKGQDAVKTPYTLYVQEDFVPKNIFPQYLSDALQHMDERTELDLVRFYSYFMYPCLKPVKAGLSEMQFKLTYIGYRKYYMYSDHPHLRRSNFFQKFGRYAEGLGPEATEYKMMITFLRKKGRALYYERHKDIFEQVNPPEEPSTVSRESWRNGDNIIVAAMRHMYRHIKFRLDYWFGKN